MAAMLQLMHSLTHSHVTHLRVRTALRVYSEAHTPAMALPRCPLSHDLTCRQQWRYSADVLQALCLP